MLIQLVIQRYIHYSDSRIAFRPSLIEHVLALLWMKYILNGENMQYIPNDKDVTTDEKRNWPLWYAGNLWLQMRWPCPALEHHH